MAAAAMSKLFELRSFDRVARAEFNDLEKGLDRISVPLSSAKCLHYCHQKAVRKVAEVTVDHGSRATYQLRTLHIAINITQ